MVFTRHAIRRYRERVRPTLTDEQAGMELERLRPLMTTQRWQPAWANADTREATAWLLLGDGVCFPLKHNVVVTCFARGTIDGALRARRNLERARRTQLARVKRHDTRNSRRVVRPVRDEREAA
jgi:hypothetical protein